MGKKKKTGSSGKPKLAKPPGGGALESKLGLLNNLNSASANERAVACGVASHMLFSEPAKSADVCKLLLGSGVVAKLLQLLCQDCDIIVISAAAKSLRNFSLTGPVACEALAQLQAPKGILTLITSERVKSASAAASQELFSHIFPLLAAIASNQDDIAIQPFLQPDFMPAVFSLLATATDSQLRMEIVSFLWVVSEDNVPLASALLSQPSMLAQLHALLAASEPSTKSAVAGVLTNAVSAASAPPALTAEITSAVLLAVSSLFGTDPGASASAMIAHLRERHQQEEAKQGKEQSEGGEAPEREGMIDDAMKESKETKESKGGEDPDGITQNEWEKLTWEQLSLWRGGVQGLKQALEVLTNIATLTEEHAGLSEYLTLEIAKHQLPSKVFGYLRCGTTTAADQEIHVQHQILLEGFLSVFGAEEAKAAVTLLHSVRSAAASCASNLCLHFPLAALGDVGVVVREACSLCRSLEWAWTGQEDWAVKEVEALTTLIWNATRKGAPLDKVQLQCVMALGRANIPSDEVRSNVAGILGVVGTSPTHFAFNFVIGTSLLALLDRFAQDENSSLELAAEVVNSLIDVYTEDNVHSTQVTQLQLLAKLGAFLPLLKKRFRKLRSFVDPVLQDRIDETLENLSQFIDYKKLHI
jgi:hypothetical protein